MKIYKAYEEYWVDNDIRILGYFKSLKGAEACIKKTILEDDFTFKPPRFENKHIVYEGHWWNLVIETIEVLP